MLKIANLPNQLLLDVSTFFHSFKPQTRKGLFLVSKFRIKRSWLRKLVTLILAATIFFFVHPATTAQVQPKDFVIKETAKAFVTVTESITTGTVPNFSAPVQGTYLSTYFSRWHQGIDLPSPLGTPVQAVAAGEVVFAGWSNLGYGNLVIVRHESGFISLYAHLAKATVKLHDKVETQGVIGLVGRSGVATGSHLHLEIHLDDSPVNPLEFISQEEIR